MGAEGTLESIAEIAVSLAGFAGIVGALAGEKLRPTHPEVWLPFWAMIASALGVLFGALFPFLPNQLGAPDHVAWAASSAFLALLTIANGTFFMPRILRGQRDRVLPRLPAFDVPLNLSLGVVLVSQLLNTLGVGFRQSGGGFLIGLYFLLLISGLNFVYLLYVLGRTPGSPPAA